MDKQEFTKKTAVEYCKDPRQRVKNKLLTDNGSIGGSQTGPLMHISEPPGCTLAEARPSRWRKYHIARSLFPHASKQLLSIRQDARLHRIWSDLAWHFGPFPVPRKVTSIKSRSRQSISMNSEAS